MSLVMAQSRRAARLDECLLLGEQRTCSGNATTSVFDPTETSSLIGCGHLSLNGLVPRVLGFCCRRMVPGAHATARFHHGTWYCGYVATRGPSAATGEDEADRYRFPFGQSQRNKRERSTALPRFFRGAKSPWLRRGPKPRGGAVLWRRATRTLCRTGPRCRQYASRLDFCVGHSSIVRLQNGDGDDP